MLSLLNNSAAKKSLSFQVLRLGKVQSYEQSAMQMQLGSLRTGVLSASDAGKSVSFQHRLVLPIKQSMKLCYVEGKYLLNVGGLKRAESQEMNEEVKSSHIKHILNTSVHTQHTHTNKTSVYFF